MRTGQLDEALVTAKIGWDSTKNLPAGNKEKSLSEFQMFSMNVIFTVLFRSVFNVHAVLEFEWKV